MNSYQTCWTLHTETAGPVSSSAFVMAATPREAKSITEQAIKSTYHNLTSITWHRTLQRVPGQRWQGRYITASTNLELPK